MGERVPKIRGRVEGRYAHNIVKYQDENQTVLGANRLYDKPSISRKVRKPVYFFGIWEPLLGEYDGVDRFPEIYDPAGVKQDPSFMKFLPWTRAELSGDTLRRKGVVDRPTGILHWEYAHYWHAFWWWDRSAKNEPGTCSVALAYQYNFINRGRALRRWIDDFTGIVQRQQFEFSVSYEAEVKNKNKMY